MTNIKLGRITLKEKSKKRRSEYSSGTLRRSETIAPVIDKTDIIRVMKRLIGIILILLAAVFGRLLSVLSAPILFFTVFAYICVQVFLWWDIFEGGGEE